MSNIQVGQERRHCCGALSFYNTDRLGLFTASWAMQQMLSQRMRSKILFSIFHSMSCYPFPYVYVCVLKCLYGLYVMQYPPITSHFQETLADDWIGVELGKNLPPWGRLALCQTTQMPSHIHYSRRQCVLASGSDSYFISQLTSEKQRVSDGWGEEKGG